MIKLKILLNGIAFIFTIFMVLYGLRKGFDAIELITNLIYFTTMVIVTFIELVEQLHSKNEQ